MAVLVETTLGDIVIDLFTKERPRCSLNFLKLCKMKYYNLCQFHSIEENYVAQTGDPSGTGTGGESIFVQLYGDNARYFEPELIPKMRHTRKGLVSMVNNGSDMLGSQFFITLADNLDFLDGKHTIFGQVTEGFDVLDKLNNEICDGNGRPYRDIRISHTVILDDPFDDPEPLNFPSRSPSPTVDLLKTTQIALDQLINEDEGKTEEEIRKEMEEKDMAAQAQILEMVGDLRHADDKPMDNVLFVCKLNPVTTDEDLEIIFSRFGNIKCCEIIRDRRTGASLQYAFIEFESAKSCEDAYFKMDNVLIDDRRIHVDFSQSVAKNYQWNSKTRKHNDKVSKEEKSKRPKESSYRTEKYWRPEIGEMKDCVRRRSTERSLKIRERSDSPVRKYSRKSSHRRRSPHRDAKKSHHSHRHSPSRKSHGRNRSKDH